MQKLFRNYKIDYSSIKESYTNKKFNFVKLSNIKRIENAPTYCPFCGRKTLSHRVGGRLLFNQDKQLFVYYGWLDSPEHNILVINGNENDTYTLIPIGDKCYDKFLDEIGVTNKMCGFYHSKFNKHNKI